MMHATTVPRERVDLVKRTICPKGISDDEFALFIEQCKRSGLDPLLKEAFCVARRANVGNPIIRLGLRLVGRREQRRFARHACERMATLVAAALARQPRPAPGTPAP